MPTWLYFFFFDAQISFLLLTPPQLQGSDVTPQVLGSDVAPGLNGDIADD